MTDSHPGTADPPRLAPARVRGIVFDLDGTLIDSYDAIAESLNRARGAFDLPPLPTAQVRRRVGRGLEELIAELVGPDRIVEGVRLFRQRYAEVFAGMTRELPGVRRTLAVLRGRGYRMAVASNKPARFGRRILEGLGLLSGLDVVHGPDTVGRHKPDPSMLDACRAEMGLNTVETLYVGDMPLDVVSAARAGVPVVLVTGGSSEREDLEATGQRVINGLEELLPLLSPRGTSESGPCPPRESGGISGRGFRNGTGPSGGQAP